MSRVPFRSLDSQKVSHFGHICCLYSYEAGVLGLAVSREICLYLVQIYENDKYLEICLYLVQIHLNEKYLDINL